MRMNGRTLDLFPDPARHWRLLVIIILGMLTIPLGWWIWTTVNAPKVLRPSYGNVVRYVTTVPTKSECIVRAEGYLGRMASAGILPLSHATRWSQMRKICVLAIAYHPQASTDPKTTAVDVIDISSRRTMFAFTTTGDVDAAQLATFNREMDIYYTIGAERKDPEEAPYYKKLRDAVCTGGSHASAMLASHDTEGCR